MRLILSLLFLLAGCGIGFAQPSSSTPISRPETKAGAFLTNELRDTWVGIPDSTNSWAVEIRQRPDWTNALVASTDQTTAQAQSGSAVAQLKLGYIYFVGAGVERDYAQASVWLAKAAEAHLAPAQFLLGIQYLNGLGVTLNFETAVELLDQAAEQRFADAEFQVGVCYLKGGPGVNQAPARGVKWLLRAAEQGKANAQQFVAWCFASGTGVTEDPSQAQAWCRKAAIQGLDTAQDFLGMFCASGYGTNQDWAEAASWFRRAAEQGLGTAQMHLAQCYSSGRGGVTNAAQAFHWWGIAAGQGFPAAQFHAGLHAYQGIGTARDYGSAANWFGKAAEQQHVGGQLYLGLCFWKGLGVSADPDAAQKWWREAAIRGIAHSLPEMGDDAADVEKWWRQVADQGNARIQCSLAEFYRFGQGVAQNEAEALKWYRKAGASGDLTGLRAAAWLLATSQKSELRDGRSAVDLAKKAAAATKRKDPKALDTLAAAYAESAQFGKAVSAENEAIALAQEDDERKDYQSRLKLYQSKFPFRAPEPVLRSPQLE